MGSFPVKNRTEPARRGTVASLHALSVGSSTAREGPQCLTADDAAGDTPPAALLTARRSGCALEEEAAHSHTMRPTSALPGPSPLYDANDADNPIRSACRCSTLSLEGTTSDLGGVTDPPVRHSLPCILRTPGSTGLTSAGTESLPTSIPHAVLNPRRGYIGDEIDLVTPCDMDDFALASIGDATAVMAFPSSITRHASSGATATTAASGHLSDRAALGGKECTEQVVDFVSFRRPGLKWCHRCQSELPPQSNFCPQCGHPTSATVGEEGPLPARDAQSGSALSIASSQDANGYVISFTTTPVTPCLDMPVPLKQMNSSRLSPASPSSVRSAANLTLVSFKDEDNSPRAYHARAYRRRVRMDLSTRGLLGRGAAGAVYKAFDVRNGQQMAVKMMDIKTADAEDLVAVRNELRHLSRLRHTNIVEYFGCRVEEQTFMQATASGDFNQSSSSFSHVEEDLISLLPSSSSRSPRTPVPEQHGMRIFILMERLECGSLVETMRTFEGGLPEMTVQAYTVQLVTVVLHVHQCGLTHRDIKPANILLASDGTIKVADFGCAAVHAALCGSPTASQHDGGDAAAHVDKGGKMAGTPAYMPPETLSLLSTPSRDTATTALHCRAQDVWGLGCTVHQLLTGEEPWSSLRSCSTPFAFLMQIEGKPFPISPSVSGAARDFLELCFELDPAVRVENSLLLPRHPFLTDM